MTPEKPEEQNINVAYYCDLFEELTVQNSSPYCSNASPESCILYDFFLFSMYFICIAVRETFCRAHMCFDAPMK